jgi:hypothetical protein
VSTRLTNRLRCFLMRQDVAGILGAGRIDGFVAFLDVLDLAVLIDDERSAIRISAVLVKNSVVLDDRAFCKVAQNWKSNSVLFGELAIGIDAVGADAENLCVVGFEFGDISLIRLHLLRSTAGEGKNIKGEHYVFLAPEITEFVPYGSFIRSNDRARQSEVRR